MAGKFVSTLPQLPSATVREFPCPKCGAAAGEPCVGARKVPQPRVSHHADRIWAAQAALDSMSGH